LDKEGKAPGIAVRNKRIRRRDQEEDKSSRRKRKIPRMKMPVRIKEGSVNRSEV
jgi:hypothetical protein